MDAEAKKALMESSQIQCFLNEATTADPFNDTPLGPDQLCGRYVSWACLNGITPQHGHAFRGALRHCGVNIRDCRLGMTGPAAADYILNSYPAVA